MTGTPEPLTPEQELFARVMFRLRIYQSNGQRYEDLFTDVMTKRHAGFRQIKPQGSRGDEGNDGFIKDEGRYFQVYAPEDPRSKIEEAAEKARNDFEKISAKWSPIHHFRFVFNDKFSGAYASVEHALEELKNEHQLESAEPFLAKDLEREFMLLPKSDREAVLGTVIPRPEHIADIDYGALTEILQHLVDNQMPVPADGLPAVPDYDEKIQFNGIDRTASLLRVGNYQNAAVEQFFDQHGEYTKPDIRNRLAQSYETARVEASKEVTATETPLGDRVFFRLLDDIVPEAGKQVQDAAIVLIAYFFEKCDVFEDPTE
ncbi:MAG: hypothetical protein KJ000_36065 [Pirellulaceae bacterium]|nr:hypothetical protein [Pirellulaceae bacterium]